MRSMFRQEQMTSEERYDEGNGSDVNDIGEVQDKIWQQYVQANLLAPETWMLR
jgi:hypothetical protein